MSSRSVHHSILQCIREAAKADSGDIAGRISNLTDEVLLRMMFVNYRAGGGAGRGLRLTNFGLQIMRRYFKGYEVSAPEGILRAPGQTLSAAHLLYLDSRATMPYHCSPKGFVMYEQDLGIHLTLADGNLDTLIEIEGRR